MYTQHHPCWDAKNRFGLPEQLPFDYTQIAHIFSQSAAPQQAKTAQVAPKPQTQNNNTQELDLSGFEDVTPINIPDGIPKALADLMRISNVDESEIRFAVADKGYFPEDMPISNYPADFINGVLIGAWPQLYRIIKENQKVPF